MIFRRVGSSKRDFHSAKSAAYCGWPNVQEQRRERISFGVAFLSLCDDDIAVIDFFTTYDSILSDGSILTARLVRSYGEHA